MKNRPSKLNSLDVIDYWNAAVIGFKREKKFSKKMIRQRRRRLEKIEAQKEINLYK